MPDTLVGHSISSHFEARSPSAAATIGPVNPFGSFLHWDRPLETAEEKKKRKILDLKQKLRNEALEEQGALLRPEMLQLNGKFKGMERYIAHDLVQRDLRDAYEKCDKAQVSAAQVAREYLDLFDTDCTSELALIDAPVFVPDCASELPLDHLERTLSEDHPKWIDLTMVGEEGTRNFKLIWTQRFLDRCERNRW